MRGKATRGIRRSGSETSNKTEKNQNGEEVKTVWRMPGCGGVGGWGGEWQVPSILFLNPVTALPLWSPFWHVHCANKTASLTLIRALPENGLIIVLSNLRLIIFLSNLKIKRVSICYSVLH